MSFFSEASAQSLTIRQMVFHLVGPKPELFTKLLAVDPGEHSDFFLDRIRAVNAGIPYEFLGNSSTRDCLQRMSDTPSSFQTESEKLAESFQEMHGGQSAAGAFLVFDLFDGFESTFALLKYDDEEVLSYELQDGVGGRKIVSLDSLERTFVKNKDALQKSALVRLNGEQGEIRVIDRQNQQKVARYYESFLSARRVQSDAQVTAKLAKAAKDAVMKNKEHVPAEILKNATGRVHEAASGGGNINSDDQKRFLETVVGQALADDHPVVRDFRSSLKRERIENIPVVLDPTNVPQATRMSIRTSNGIRINFHSDQSDLIQVEGDKIIISDTILEEYDASDNDR